MKKWLPRPGNQHPSFLVIFMIILSKIKKTKSKNWNTFEIIMVVQFDDSKFDHMEEYIKEHAKILPLGSSQPYDLKGIWTSKIQKFITEKKFPFAIEIYSIDNLAEVIQSHVDKSPEIQSDLEDTMIRILNSMTVNDFKKISGIENLISKILYDNKPYTSTGSLLGVRMIRESCYHNILAHVRHLAFDEFRDQSILATAIGTPN